MYPPNQEARPSRLPSLTGMRFIAAAMVFVFHGATQFIFANQETGGDFLFAASNLGSVGVSFFFVLSGFVLAWSARPGDTRRAFWRRRFFKVFPNHLVMFVIAVVLILLAGLAFSPGKGFLNLTLLHVWVPDHSYLESGNGVAWTLGVEALFYLLFPVIFPLLGRIRPNRLWFAAGITVALVIAVPAVSLAFVPDAPQWPWGPASWQQIWFVYVFPVARLLEFVLGIIMARIVLSGRWIPLGLPSAVGLMAVGYLASLYLPVHFLYDYVAMTVIPLALLVPAAAVADVEGRRTLLRGRTARRLGEISFAFYLTHYLVMQYGHRSFGLSPDAFGQLAGPQWSTPVAIAFLVGCFAVALVTAWGLYALVERPAMRRWSRGPKPEPAPVETVPAETVPAEPAPATAGH